ncbi:MAG: ketopantoate reductase family protein [Dethiosulfatibacter sp.]|nr:ketopantoate reductase family protein [Dethiosulfatibacter sp.]
MKAALIGAGSIGTILGALVAKSGKDIVLIDNHKEHVEALNKYGARITGHLNETIPVKAITPDQMEGKYDLIISLTKQTTIRESLNSAKLFMHDETIVLTLQNGIPEDISKEIVGEKRVMGGGVEFSATWLKPGVSELTCPVLSCGITFGRINGEIDDKVKEVQDFFSGLMHVEVVDNLLGMRYTKLTDNSVFSALPTALNCDVGKVLDSEAAMRVIAHLGMEAAEIISALGIRPVKLFGLEPLKENLCFKNEMEMERVIKDYWTPIYTPYRDQIASMLQDIRHGKKCEINFINGKFVEKGKELGIKTPYMEKVVEIITKLQDGELSLENAWNNLNLFDIPRLD